jgi:uncharacterized membrane protein YhdT
MSFFSNAWFNKSFFSCSINFTFLLFIIIALIFADSKDKGDLPSFILNPLMLTK